jgi:hypothetical protein
MKITNQSSIDFSQLTIPDIKCAVSLSDEEKMELLALLKTSYPHFSLDQVFNHYPCKENLYVYRMRLNNTLVASRQFLIIDESSESPSWVRNMNEVFQYQRFAIGSRAIVHPILRGFGLGSKLVKNVNKEIFDNHNIEIIYGSSTNLSAITLYLRLGAKLWKGDTISLFPETVSPASRTALYNQQTRKTITHKRLASPVRYYYQNNSIKSDTSWNRHHVSGNKNRPVALIAQSRF